MTHLRIALCAQVILATGCSTEPIPRGEPCSASDTCQGEFVCFEGVCRMPCNSDDVCALVETCSRGVCLPGTGRDDSGDPAPGDPACVQCPQETPACVAGSCECVTGSCPAGQYCDSGTCRACDCPTMFSTCVDQGDTSVCRCTDASCGADGRCEENATTCVYADDFDGTTSMLTLCDSGISENSTWERGKPPFVPCHSTPNCWVTGLGRNYNNCELSCVESPVLDLAGVTGRIDVYLWALYLLEEDFDGITPLFLADNDELVVLDPADGWDADFVNLDGRCPLEFHEWPAFGQYETADPIGWTQIHFGTEQATHPSLFHDGFLWRVYLQSDGAMAKLGWHMDDVEVRVTQVP